MEGESSEFQGWEVLNHGSGPAMIRSDLEEAAVEVDSEGMIRADYFSIDSHERYGKIVSEVELSDGSVESDNPSWVDPGLENRYGRKISGEFWSDSGSDRSDERKFSDSDAKAVEMESGVGVDGIGDEFGASDANSGMIEPGECIYSCLDAKTEAGLVENDKSDVGFERFGEMMNQEKDLDRFWSDSNDVMVSMKFGDGSGHYVELEGGNSSKMESSGEGDEHSSDNKESEDSAIVEMKPNLNPIGAGDKRRVVWWKVPLEFLKHCAFLVSPGWSLSVAAALMGFIILGRRLSRMKRKAQSLQLKVTVDQKKVSLFKSRAARLNEAFSVVRRVPVTRPSHTAAGLASWPMMSLR